MYQSEADMNFDGVVNFMDICPFVDALGGGGGGGLTVNPPTTGVLLGDVNRDGVFSFLDTDPFVDLLRCTCVFSGGLSSVSESVPGDFFWSLQGLNSGATNSAAEIELTVGETALLYLYYSTDGPTNADIDRGVTMDITLSDPGTIKFLGADSFNFDILINGRVFSQRWLRKSFGLLGGYYGPATNVTDNSIECLAAFTILQPGIIEDNDGTAVFFDQGFDVDANAFLFGAVEICAIAPGETNLVIGNVGAVNDCQPIDLAFAPAAIAVKTSVLLGDVNLDGSVNLLDIDPFVERVGTTTYQAEADCNEDGQVNLLDVDFFIAILNG